MPYRFKSHEPVEKGFRRIAREQLDFALAELAGAKVGAKNVHECRKSLKRLRSLVRLSADAIGGDKARKRNKVLGEIAGLLSARRDRTVMLETISKLSRDVANAEASLAPLRSALTADAPDEPETLDPDIARKAQHLLVREAEKFAKMPFSKRGFAALSGGLMDSYRKGRKAGKYAYEEPTDENFHDLRKAVQWHWRQMSLLSKAWPDEFAVRAHAARELSQLLGDDHDLAVLIAAATKSPAMTDEQKDAAIALCRQQQQLLRGAAEYRAKRLFAEKPQAFVGRVASYWRCSRSLDPQLEVQPPPGQVDAQDEAAPVAAEVRKPASELQTVRAKPRMAAKDETRAQSQRRA